MRLAPMVLGGLVAALAWGAGGSPLKQAPPEAADRNNPLGGSEKARKAGEKLYEQECAACHGADREGSRKVPALNGPNVRQASPGALFWVLRNGSLWGGMPSFAHLPAPERWQIVTYLRSAAAPAEAGK